MFCFLCSSTLNVAAKTVNCSGYFTESEANNNNFFPIETKLRIKKRIVNSYFLFDNSSGFIGKPKI